MPRRNQFQAVLCSFLLLCLPATGFAHSWRTWDAEDNRFDSYSLGVQVDAQGLVWVDHGSARPLSIIDGYRIRRVEVPSTGEGGLEVGADEAWVLDRRGVQRFSQERWKLYKIPEIAKLGPDARSHLRLVSVARGRVVIVKAE